MIDQGGPVTRAEVETAVKAQLGSDAIVDTWTVNELGRGRGDATTSLGVVRVSGTARVGTQTVPWSQIRKVYVPPEPVNDLDMGRAADHWNYWRREPELFASGILDELPHGVAAPAAYLVRHGDSAITVWMDDLGDLDSTAWTPTALEHAAYGLGLLSGAFAGQAPSESWLSQDLLGQWIRDLPGMITPLSSPMGWDHSVARAVFPIGSSGPVPRLLSDPARHAGPLNTGPRTLCHRDTGVDNLFLKTDADGVTLVLFDWALAGAGAVGEDLGVLFASAARQVAADPLRVCRDLVDPYRSGIEAAGGTALERDDVWRTATVTAALREAIFAAFHISRGIEAAGWTSPALTGLARDGSVIEAFAETVLQDAC